MGRDGRVVPADPTGQSTILDADKQSIMNRVQIHARDLRILDPYPSPILVRDRAIILNLEHIKAIIAAEEILLRDPPDENVIPVVSELLRRLHPVNTNSQGQGDGKEFLSEHNDVEASEEDELALEAICSFLDARTTELEAAAYPALDKLTSKVRDELEQLLDDDYDMADLYLSRKLPVPSSPVKVSGHVIWFSASPAIASRISRVSQVSMAALGSRISRASQASMATIRGSENDVEELKMLLEAYFMQSDSMSNKLTALREYIDDSEDYINIQLDNHGNQLIQVVIITWVFCAALFVLIMSYSRYKGLDGS